ncbi:elongation factor 1-beta-like [Schistocerca gregaria]|uniref:elongation factor 1-beta-like n=1 Tax=Schistocerca gregaria TaxID=7010 RepID=UPI00211E129E|nr:elongation factor 1-beta-like [Schistocerca gregaria]
MSKFLPLNNNQAFGKLNGHLANESYITGYQPTSDDALVFKEMGKAPEEKWTHILRWYNHISHFKDSINSWPKPAEVNQSEADGEDIDLFGEETEEEKAANESRKQAAKAKPAKAPVIERSAIILDVKPWGEEVDLLELEKKIRTIKQEGLEWKASKLDDIAYGIKKLQIACHVVDDLVSVEEDVIMKIQEFEDMVQSVDIFSFNKL